MGDTLNSIMPHRFETWQKNWPCDTDIDHPVGEIVPNRFLFNKRFQCSYVTSNCKNSSSFVDIILELLVTLLTRLHNFINEKKSVRRRGSLRGMSSNDAFEIYQSNNNGFIFDIFYGQVSNKLYCKSCKKSIGESFQLFKSFGLPIPSIN